MENVFFFLNLNTCAHIHFSCSRNTGIKYYFGFYSSEMEIAVVAETVVVVVVVLGFGVGAVLLKLSGTE